MWRAGERRYLLFGVEVQVWQAVAVWAAMQALIRHC